VIIQSHKSKLGQLFDIPGEGHNTVHHGRTASRYRANEKRVSQFVRVERNDLDGSPLQILLNDIAGWQVGERPFAGTYDENGNLVKVIGSYMNLAAGKIPTGDVTIVRPQVVTDNDSWAESSTQYATTSTNGLHYVKIDLGAAYPVNKINVWHYANDGRTYHSTKTQVSANGTTWVTVYDSAVSGEYAETPQGKTITFTTQNVQYIRDYVNGNTVNNSDHWTEIEVWGYGTMNYIGNYFEWTGSTATMVKYYYAGNNRVAMRRGTSSVYYLLADHLGSQAITADTNGSKISEVRYYPWGEDRYYAYTSSTTYRFTGQRTEFGLGLMYYGARWYDPYLNRWIQPDSIISNLYYSTDLDRYSYVRNNPTNYIDPTGNKPCDGNNTSLDQCNGITNDDLIQVLKIVYRWKVIGNWTKKELNNLIDSANYVEKGVDLLTNGNGKGWMYSTMSNISFVHTSGTDFVLEQIGNIFNNGLPIAGMVPFDSSSAYLYQGEINFATVTHELGHVWDINSGNGICPATWCGGGPADELTVYLGGDPGGTRWTNGTNGMPQWLSDVHNGYGNHSTADYFAESFEWMLFYLVNPNHTSYLPNTDVLNWIISNASGGGQ